MNSPIEKHGAHSVTDANTNIDAQCEWTLRVHLHTAIVTAQAMSLKWVHSISVGLFTFSDGERQRKSNITIAIA